MRMREKKEGADLSAPALTSDEHAENLGLPDDSISARRRILLLSGVLVFCCAAVAAACLQLLYNAAFDQESLRLREMAYSRAIQIEAMARQLQASGDFGASNSPELVSAVLQMQEASLDVAPSFQSTAARNIGYRDGQSLRIIEHDPDSGKAQTVELPLRSDLGVPMRRAVEGHSGILVAPDAHGEMVLAAYEPVSDLGLGVVAKVALSEVRRPFFSAAWLAAFVSLVVVLLGVLLITRLSNPVIRRLAAVAQTLRHAKERYQRMFTGPSSIMLLVDPASGEIVEANPAARQFYGLEQQHLNEVSFRSFLSQSTAELRPMLARIGTGEALQAEMPHRLRGGEIRYMDVSATPIEVDGRPLLYCILNDVTGRRLAQQEREAQDWLKSGLARFDDAVRAEQSMASLTSAAIREMARYLDAQVGTLFTVERRGESPTLTLAGSYAYSVRKNLSNRFAWGEGLVGQAALEKQTITVRNVPEDYVRIVSGTGEAVPQTIVVSPILRDGEVCGVVELGFLRDLTPLQTQYLEQCLHALAVLMDAVLSRDALAQALQQAQQLSEELQTQQEELRATNEELEAQAAALVASEQKLKAQQEELRATNEELSEKTTLLEGQKLALEEARGALEGKARDLDQANKYKSQFLANMSHELRTPLNSLLLLSQVVAENKAGNLSVEQVESLRMIHSSGEDLLNLINDILDLARIEAGRTETSLSTVSIADVAGRVNSMFRASAEAKGLQFNVTVDPSLPPTIATDPRRMEQILRNLAANAVKFTEAGSVSITFYRPSTGIVLRGISTPVDSLLAVAVKDTGIGIAPEHQEVVFEAFRQADGGINRRFGGTGLGLAISRELARLLGGDVLLESQPGQGSVFTLYLPMSGWTPAVVPSGPAVAQPQTTQPNGAATSGATGAAAASVPNTPRRVLVVEDGTVERSAVVRLLSAAAIATQEASTGEQAIATLTGGVFDCVILDLTLPDMSGLEVLRRLRSAGVEVPPVVVHTCRDLTREEESAIREHAEAIVLKGASSAQRLMDEVSLLLHRLAGPSQERKKVPLSRLGGEDEALKGKKVLVVDDDMRTVFAVSRLLNAHGMKTLKAENGEKALEVVAENPDLDMVLMDVMMPVMDGLTAIRRLRAEERFAKLPILVLTAKAMKGDREQCLESGASDYLAKPLDQDRLLSMMRVWLYKK